MEKTHRNRMDTKETKVHEDWIWDKWQQKVLDHEGNITLRTGRQVGKSEVVSAKAIQFALKHPNTTTMIIAAAQRQSSMLFEKVRGRLDFMERKEKIKYYSEKPTMTKIKLVNGSTILSLPVGRTGYFIRGYTLDLLIADEAAYIPETCWLAITPMIAVSRKMRGFGRIILLSTPFGKGGYFYDSFNNKAFKSFHVSSEKCSRMDKKHLRSEKKRMSSREYRQEYLGEFTDDMSQFFKNELIKDSCSILEWEYDKDYKKHNRYYLGVDFAGYGGDENAFVVCEMEGEQLRIVKCWTTERVSATDTIGRIIEYNSKYNFNKIFVDDGGLGSPITDILQDRLGRKVVGLNNASKRIEVQGEEKNRGILKEDLYSNALTLMEQGKLQIIRDLDIIRSLKSITFSYGDNISSLKKLHIYGNYAHLTEALVRSCWCTKERGLRLFCY